jgi:hypothetical protein
MAIKQLTVLFGNNYELNVPVTEHTHCHFIDGHEVMTLAVKEVRPCSCVTKPPEQKEFPWMAEYARQPG